MVAAQAKFPIFTCMDDDRTVAVRAADVADADKRSPITAAILIQGRVKDIGARRVKVTSFVAEAADRLASDILVQGSVCSLLITDPIKIDDAVYEETEDVNGYPYLRFRKNDIVFWACEYDVYFIRIGDHQFS